MTMVSMQAVTFRAFGGPEVLELAEVERSEPGADDVLVRVHAAGIPQLAITDGPGSPLVPLSTMALYARTHSAYFANSESSALALIEALSSAVSHAAKGSLRAAADLTESVLPWLDGRHTGRLRPVEADPLPLPAKRKLRPVLQKKSR